LLVGFLISNNGRWLQHARKLLVIVSGNCVTDYIAMSMKAMHSGSIVRGRTVWDDAMQRLASIPFVP